MFDHENAHRDAYGGPAITGYNGNNVYTRFGRSAVRDELLNGKGEPENAQIKPKKTLSEILKNKKKPRKAR